MQTSDVCDTFRFSSAWDADGGERCGHERRCISRDISGDIEPGIVSYRDRVGRLKYRVISRKLHGRCARTPLAAVAVISLRYLENGTSRDKVAGRVISLSRRGQPRSRFTGQGDERWWAGGAWDQMTRSCKPSAEFSARAAKVGVVIGLPEETAAIFLPVFALWLRTDIPVERWLRLFARCTRGVYF